MKTFTAFFCLLFVANGVLGDVYSAAIRQAKNVTANASSTRQDNPPPPAQPPPAPPSQNNPPPDPRSEEHTSELQSLRHLVCRLLLEKNKQPHQLHTHTVQ